MRKCSTHCNWPECTMADCIEKGIETGGLLEAHNRKLAVRYMDGNQWIKIDDVIKWAKTNELHEVAAAFVRLKNDKPISK